MRGALRGLLTTSAREAALVAAVALGAAGVTELPAQTAEAAASSVRTTSSELRAALPVEPEPVAVTVTHRIDAAEAAVLTIRGLALGGARVSELRMSAKLLGDQEETPVPASPLRRLRPELSAEPGGVYRGGVELPPEMAGAPLEVVLSYRVSGAAAADGDDLRYGLPVLVVGEAQAEARPGLFKAFLEVPDGVGVYESFPTGFRTRDDVQEEAGSGAGAPSSDAGPSDASRVAYVELEVIPAVVTLRARRGGAPLLAGVRLLDALSVVALVLLGVFGWRYLVREGERADAQRPSPGATRPEDSAGAGRAP